MIPVRERGGWAGHGWVGLSANRATRQAPPLWDSAVGGNQNIVNVSGFSQIIYRFTPRSCLTVLFCFVFLHEIK